MKRLIIIKQIPTVVAELAQFGRHIVQSMGPPNSWFTSPPVPYTTVTQDIVLPR